jgi:hypothetical protein
MWVKRLFKTTNASWKAYPNLVLKTLIGINSFKTQLDTVTNPHKITPFYWDILKSWINLNEINKEEINVPDIRADKVYG